MTSRARRPTPDESPDQLEIAEPQQSAAGWPAVAAAARVALRQMGPVRSTKTLLRVNQAGGFDCPGCAWPESTDRSHAEFCENGVKAVAEEATRHRITAAFFAEHSLDDLSAHDDYWLGQQGRLVQPMIKRPGGSHYEPIEWDDAFALIGDELRALGNPDEAVFYTSGRTSNEAAFLYQLFARVLGTNNLPDCSNMCHESSGAALMETIGVSKGTVSLADIEQADLIFVIGQNPGTNHPRMLSTLEAAKRRGAQVVAVNPLPEAGLLGFKNPQRVRGLLRGIGLADQFLQIRVNGDLALFQGLNRLLLEHEQRSPGRGIDRPFIDAYCEGVDDFIRHTLDSSWSDILEATGLERREIEEVHERVLASERIVACWAMGLTQHANAVATIREVMNFLLLGGNIGKPGAGACPVRGHSNVQGDRTMGIHEKPADEFLDRLAAEFSFAPPRASGYDTVDAIRAMRDGRVRIFMGLGGNFVAAAPDTEITRAALRRCRLTVQVSTKLNRSHLVGGETALILPCLGRTECDDQASGPQFVTVEDSMGNVHASRGRLRPASTDLLSEVAIVCRIAMATLGNENGAFDWAGFQADYDTIRARIEQVVPGFDDFNRRAREPHGFTLPHDPRDHRRFPTPSGRARFVCNSLEPLSVPDGHLVMQTLRSHDQYNTTIYGLDDRYRGVRHGRRVVFVNPHDLLALDLRDGDLVDIVGHSPDGRDRRARNFRVVSYPIALGTCASYFPETNVLVPLDSTAATSNTPTSKSIMVRFERRDARGAETTGRQRA
jgi:formate dehydrogenase major subunit